MSARPLDDLRVLEMGQLMAGPFAGTVLGYFGAEVIKIEPPEGDPVRRFRKMDGDTSLWWSTLGRNKKCITLDLRREEGRALARRLAGECDVLIENFRPGTLEKWGLAPEVLEADNPKLIVARVSGFGQTGPYASQPGYASVCEAFGGLRYVTGNPGEPPVRANLSLGDSLCGLHAALGILLALLHRERTGAGRGQRIDVSIFESVYNLMEAVVPEYDRLGEVRQPSGSTITGVVPSNTYPCADGQQVVIGANGESLYRRLMAAAGREDLGNDPRLASNEGRVEHQEEIDRAIAAWTSTLTREQVLHLLEVAKVPAGPIYSVADMATDPHYRARGLFEKVEWGGRALEIPAMMPKLEDTPGRTEWPGPTIGAHTREVLTGLLKLTDEELADLEGRAVI
ncbi:MAG: CaiB/BaiF CoA-transferase family protein [Acidobacteriota bacterium]